ncbi:MAG: 3-ketoacyl-ACP reductase FabG2 [Parvibaculum sp.]|jgi:3-oxoacyl-[acyl-carrier protein] reductase|uniref:3-ketoacyl-ACP reductase FabG2 n=1 Tax=Parvibaculum sp. TaxID=2024848 RepID=UPI00284AF96F|nr:3-ketoacyl-ACP reductase FabG2 [Parvibaculum sp.]MDR3500922.1 3-ketoacyl-ACP reductase FabG2 [Parvibaculum sp.]
MTGKSEISEAAKRSILVTGASKGIGRAIAIRVARAGFPVTVHYGQDRAGAEEAVRQIELEGGFARMLGFDVANRDEAKAALAADVAAHGAYWGVVLNAGIARDNAFPALSGDDWDRVLTTNLDGFFNVLHPLSMPMIRRKDGGRVVAISSVSGVIGNRGQVNYSAAKAGIIGATKALAVELATRNITVNCVAPGIIETAMIDGAPIAEILKIIPMQRLGQPEEVAGIVAFLLSDEASYITRQVISVNGGIS